MRTHLKIHEGELGKTQKCKYCPFKTRYKNSLDIHIRIHLNLKPFHCKICKKSFRAWPSIKYHYLKSHHLSKEEIDFLLVKGGVGDEKFVSSRLRCTVCRICFKNKEMYDQHFISIHGKTIEEIDSIEYKPKNLNPLLKQKQEFSDTAVVILLRLDTTKYVFDQYGTTILGNRGRHDMIKKNLRQKIKSKQNVNRPKLIVKFKKLKPKKSTHKKAPQNNYSMKLSKKELTSRKSYTAANTKPSSKTVKEPNGPTFQLEIENAISGHVQLYDSRICEPIGSLIPNADVGISNDEDKGDTIVCKEEVSIIEPCVEVNDVLKVTCNKDKSELYGSLRDLVDSYL